MNRLFIIGNGFDLAHGLPTSYNHFINNFWITLPRLFQEDLHKELLLVDESYTGIFNYVEPTVSFSNHIKNLKEYAKNRELNFNIESFTLSKRGSSFHEYFKFKNKFFLLINKNQSIDNWVDIENAYYTELKKIVKSESLNLAISEDDWTRKKKEKIIVLNREFNQIKILFINYLKKVINDYNFSYDSQREWVQYYHLLKPISVFDYKESIHKQFNDADDIDYIDQVFEKEKTTGDTKTTAYFLSFNYTPSLNRYISSFAEEKLNVRLNHIHGKVDEDVVFGFGDESDADYPAIENLNENEYLNFFKSFSYLENDRYHNLLNYIDSNPYQIVVMGHSLGLSDRILLKTIMEDNNCKSIKVYYHKDEKGDNYRDIIQNLSRHFTDNTVMRKKVVNKLLCEPLPQIKFSLNPKNS